jgi:hypothetical protein
MTTHRVLIGTQVLEICIAAGLELKREKDRVVIDFAVPTPPTVEKHGIRGIAVPDDAVERATRYLRAA